MANLKSDFDYKNSPFNNGKEIFVVINFRDGEIEKAVQAFDDLLTKKTSPLFDSPLNEYATILHLEDKNEKGETEHPHIHLWADMAKGQSKQNWIDTFAKFFDLEAVAVQVQAVAKETDACLRYLIHKGYAKTQHDPEEVRTNVPTKCASAWSEALKKVNYDLDEVAECKSKREIAQLVGLRDYHKAKEFWEDMQEEKRQAQQSDFEAEFGRVWKRKAWDFLDYIAHAKEALRESLRSAKPENPLWAVKYYLDLMGGDLENLLNGCIYGEENKK